MDILTFIYNALELLIKIPILVTCIVLILLCLEYVTHPKYSLVDITIQLKKDVRIFFSEFFKSEKPRHDFDIGLYYDLKEIVKPYAHDVFEILTDNNETVISNIGTIPYFSLTFVPNKKHDPQELLELVQLILIKFRDYLGAYNLGFASIGTYKNLPNNKIMIIIYYAEFERDNKPFQKLYNRIIVQNSTKERGVIHDDTLDREINNVN